ncbi:tetratricopeptide repeat protein [Nostoc sp. ChiQUE01b]|uniref:tetratricopeptide repeat protein n=1 Tax=Nostoc sp. ChiQUE01b TaxID=3075376 RepID=UPI002AD354E6|nr:tetratricopeptide repeat protein [Nostoc sp. ChiQUE01b]MDZ8260990.1 tetratricopeptide repeat protein [Nostoc sp. ChiQUE01b]
MPASNSPSNEGLPAIANEVNSIAQEITVLIKLPKGNGSGVIIAKKENTYYVLTAEHVLRDQTNLEVKVVTPDGNSHIVKVSDNTVKKLSVDLAVLQFTSSENYQVATLANHDLEKKGGLVFVSGWVGSKPNEGKIIPLFTAGTLFEKQWGILQAKDPVRLTYGYGLVYTNVTEGGVSGGPILDSRGDVIGIHGRAEAEVVVEQAGYGRRTMNLGYSLGIPISTFLSLLTHTGIESGQLKIYNKQPLPLTDKEQNSIVKALLKLKQPTDNSDAVAWLNFGNQQWRLSNYEDALAAFDQAIRISPKLYEAWYARGLSLLSQEKYSEALDAFNKAIQASQESKKEFAPAWRGRGQALINLNRYKEALESFEKAIALKPEDLLVYIWQGTVLQTLGRYEDAIIAYDKAIGIKPHPLAYYNRGLVYGYLGRRQQAIADFKKVIEISPDYADAYISLGHEEYTSGNKNAALDYFNKAIQIAPYYAGGYFNRGIFRYYLEDKQQGINDLGKAIQLDPKNPYFYFRWGGIYYNEGDYQEAIRYYDKALKINPLIGEFYYSRGLANYKIENPKAALENFQQAVRLFTEQGKDFFSKQAQARIQEIQSFSSNVDLRNVATYQGNALNTTYKYPGHVTIKIAEIDFKSRKIKVQIEFTQGLNGEGLLEGVINSNNVADLSGIVGTLETAGFFDTKVKIEFIGNDKLKGVYTLEAGANNIAGRTQNGEFTATKVKEVSQDNSSKEGLNTQDAEVYLKRANARRSQGDYDGAITNYNEAIRLKANYAEAYFGRAIAFALAQKDEKQKAIEDFNTVLRLQPNSLDAYYYRGLVRADLKQYKEAIEDYTQVLRPQEFSGIGVKTELNPQTKVLIVTEIIKNSPAQRGGLKPGDQILAIDGKSTTGMNLEQAVQLIRGKVGTSVKLRAIHADKSAFNVSIIRAQIFDSKFAEVYYNRGLAYAKQGDKQRASEDFQKSAELYQQQDNKEMYKIVMDKVRELQK